MTDHEPWSAERAKAELVYLRCPRCLKSAWVTPASSAWCGRCRRDLAPPREDDPGDHHGEGMSGEDSDAS